VDGKSQTSKGIKPIVPTMTLQELKEAEDAIIRCAQAQSHGKGIRAINDIMKSDEAAVRKIEKRKKAQIKKTSSIHRFNPFLWQTKMEFP
jgi:hypothetical protein